MNEKFEAVDRRFDRFDERNEKSDTRIKEMGDEIHAIALNLSKFSTDHKIINATSTFGLLSGIFSAIGMFIKGKIGL